MKRVKSKNKFSQDGASPHFINQVDEIDIFRKKCCDFHGRCGCTVSEPIRSINFVSVIQELQSKKSDFRKA